MKNTFIIQLDSYIQTEIKKEVELFCREELNLSEKKIEEELELAMSSRLVDVEEIVDIEKYIN